MAEFRNPTGIGFHRRSQRAPHQRRHRTVLSIARTPRMNAIARHRIGDAAATRHGYKLTFKSLRIWKQLCSL